MTLYTSKEISDLTGLSIPTLRYYEQIGLLDPVDRADNGHRRYSDCDVRRIGFLKRVRETGMSINQMLYYVNLFREGEITLSERLEMLIEHRQSVQRQMDALAETIAFLDTKIENYQQDMQDLAKVLAGQADS